MRTTTRARAAAGATMLALALSGCSGGDATFEGPGEATSPAAEQTTAPGESAPASPSGTASASVQPAADRTVEVEEVRKVTDDDVALTLTLHRVTVHDYYIEVELTAVNDADDQVTLWYGDQLNPTLFDDRGRQYRYQVQAGYESRGLELRGGEGVDAVFVFAGALDPDATSLTLGFEKLVTEGLKRETFEIPVGGTA